MVLLLNASVLLETREKKRVNKFGGKEKTHTHRDEGMLQAIERSKVFQIFFIEKRKIIRQTNKPLNW